MLNREFDNSFTICSEQFFDADKPEELEMDTNSLHFALSEENMGDIVLSLKRNQWNALRLRDSTENFTANATDSFFPSLCSNREKKHKKPEPAFFTEELRCEEVLCLWRKTYCCYERMNNSYNISSKGLKKRILKDSSDEPMSKYRKVLDEASHVTSTKKRFQHSYILWQPTEKPQRVCPIFNPKICRKWNLYIKIKLLYYPPFLCFIEHSKHFLLSATHFLNN